MRFPSWLKRSFHGKTKRASRSKGGKGKTLKAILEILEARVAPATLTIDTDNLGVSYSASSAAAGNTLYGTPYTTHLTDNNQVVELDIAGSLNVPAGDRITATGSSGRGIWLVVGHDANIAGNVAVAGALSISAASVEIGGAVSARTVTVAASGTLNINAEAAIVVRDGGSLTLGGQAVINSGVLHADGANGGHIAISANDFQNSGLITANGNSGPGAPCR